MRLLALSGFIILFILALPYVSSLSPVLQIDSPQNRQYFTPDITFTASTPTVISNVSYSLNSGNFIVLYNNSLGPKSILITGKQGDNRITARAENGTEKISQTIDFKVEKCTFDLRDIKPIGNSIVFTAENTGTVQQIINYTIKVNLEKIRNSLETVNSGETKSVSTPYTFTIGKTYQLEAIGKSDCGGTDAVTLGYSKTGPSPCINPDGEHNTFRTNSTDGKTYRCNNSLWEDIKVSGSAEYEYCKTSRCGDGVINCGETQYTCLQDYNSSAARCDCYNKTFYGEAQKPFAEEFYQLCKTNCSLDCLSDYDCKAGDYCRGLTCSPKLGRCAVQIRDLDYTKEMSKGQTGFVFANIKNTGLIRENISARLYVDNVKVNDTHSVFDPDTDRFVSMPYTGSPGKHNFTFEAKTNDCLSSDTKQLAFFTVNEIPVVKSPDLPLSTEVALQKNYLKTSSGVENAFFLDIQTNQPQIFDLKVSGVPEDWLDYPKTVGITESRTLNIFVKPKQAGEFNLTIEIQGKEKSFTSSVTLKVDARPSQKELDPLVVIAVSVSVIVLLLIVVFLGSKYLKLEA